ncbi:MAG: PD40 domain-containing protein [Ignavibacteriales bacterium]|nr:PD40 domain-containing protein [Ignavibacteriales bacterium]
MKKLFFSLLFFFSILISAQNDYQLIIRGTMEDAVLNPVFSPDGKNIAFTKNNYLGIWVYNLQTKKSIQLTDEMAAGFAFKWSSDSKSILTRVAKYENQKRYNAIKVFDISTNESKQLTNYKTIMPYLPQWADGDTKIFLPEKTNDEIFVTDKSKNNFNQNSLVVFEKNNKLIVKNLNDNSERIFEPIKDAQYISLSTSPDYSKMVFKVVGGNMFVISLDGTNLIDLGIGNAPQWSSDSKKIVFEITKDDGYNFTASDIFSVNADGTQKINLTNTNDKIEMNPCFTPDNKAIVFNVVEDGSIYLMNIE